jgi:dTDP-4-amino-4,6-dideoxygalactose transaminase
VRAKKNGCLPKILVPVHFSGQPTEQEAIWDLAREYGYHVLEDASHAIGATRNGEPVGSCRWSDITVFSFHPVKIITTGEGGMALTNDAELAARMAMLRSHGITRDPARFVARTHATEIDIASERRPPAWYYEQQLLGYNYRITDIQAALGTSQLERLDQYIARRNELARRYDHTLGSLPLQLPTIQAENNSAFHLYVVRLRRNAVRKTHCEVFDELRQRGIGVNLHYMPVHLQPYYRNLGFTDGQYPEAEAYGESAITLPLYAGLTDAQQDRVVAALKEVL